MVSKRNSVNQSIQKEMNLSVVLHAIRSDPQCTRIKLAEITGLAQTSVTKIIAQLMDWGVVSEQESIGVGVGRRAIRLQVNAERYRVAAVRINRRYIIAAICDMNGHLYDMIRHDVSAVESADACMERLISMLSALLSRSDYPIMSIGVAVPGPFNYNTGRITLMSGFPGWSEIDIGPMLAEAFHLPVFVDQDANCGALAEMWYSPAPSNANMIFVTADRGIGAGFILNGSVYHGSDGYAGEIGHSSINVMGPRCECGNRGCLELYGSTVALENTYRQDVLDLLNPGPDDVNVMTGEILELVRAGDPVACRAYTKTVTYLCFGVVGLINTLNPDTIVFGDKIIDGGELFLKVANQTFAQYLIPEIYKKLHIKMSALGGNSMLLGAGVLAFDQMMQTPSVFFQHMVNEGK